MTISTPVFCIFCTQLRERRLWAEQHHKEYGLNVTMFQAVYGETWGIGSTTSKISAGHIALNISHWMLWQHIWLAGYGEALILEDDCRFCDNFIDRYLLMRTAVPNDWQVVFVGALDLDRQPKNVINTHVVKLLQHPIGTHCYLIKRSAIPIMLEHTQRTNVCIDVLLWENVLKDKLAWYAAYPSLASQNTYDGGWPSST